ncbi:MAG: hypothetical protein RI554_05150 [Trueperaceae bacterium]|nr:hypothetical protein [Trueperaceae bacterium]
MNPEVAVCDGVSEPNLSGDERGFVGIDVNGDANTCLNVEENDSSVHDVPGYYGFYILPSTRRPVDAGSTGDTLDKGDNGPFNNGSVVESGGGYGFISYRIDDSFDLFVNVGCVDLFADVRVSSSDASGTTVGGPMQVEVRFNRKTDFAPNDDLTISDENGIVGTLAWSASLERNVNSSPQTLDAWRSTTIEPDASGDVTFQLPRAAVTESECFADGSKNPEDSVALTVDLAPRAVAGGFDAVEGAIEGSSSSSDGTNGSVTVSGGFDVQVKLDRVVMPLQVEDFAFRQGGTAAPDVAEVVSVTPQAPSDTFTVNVVPLQEGTFDLVLNEGGVYRKKNTVAEADTTSALMNALQLSVTAENLAPSL